jgi:hypothetical protein
MELQLAQFVLIDEGLELLPESAKRQHVLGAGCHFHLQFV